MRGILKHIRKEFLYDCYIQIEDDPKDYTKITRYKMHEEAMEMLRKEPAKLKSLLRLDELDDMLRIAHESDGNGLYFTDGYYFNQPSGMMLFGFENFDENSGSFMMEENIREYFENFEYSDQEQELIYFLYFVEGMVETYGIIDYEDIEEIYENQRKKKYRKYLPMKIRGNEAVENHLLRKYHALYLDGIVHDDIEEDDIFDYITLNRELYSLDYYYHMGKYRLPFVNIEEFKNFKRDKKQFSILII